MPILYLIDGSAYIHRAYHAVAPLSTSVGQPVNAVYGFTTILRRLIREREPQYMAVAFDTRGPVFRHDLYADYKANRPPMPEDLAAQIEAIHETVRAFGILSLMAGDQEADDLIASASACMSGQGVEIVVVSGDKDLAQLVSARVQMWDPMKNLVLDEAGVAAKYGVGPGHLLDYLALTGDTADNVPGVPGIGPKTAARFIAEYGTLEVLYAAAPGLRQSRAVTSLLEHREQAFLSRDLVRLNTRAEVPRELAAYAWPGPDTEALRALWTRLEFQTLLKELPGQRQTMDKSGFRLVTDGAELRALVQRLMPEPVLAVDTETTGLDPRRDTLVGVSLALDEKNAWYLPCGHKDPSGARLPGQLEPDALAAALAPLLANPQSLKVGHNLKFDLAMLAAPQNGGIALSGPLYDTMIGAWLLNPERRSLKLDEVAGELGLAMTSFAEVTDGDKAADAFCRVSLEAARDYSCEDAAVALALYHAQQPQLEAAGLTAQMREVEAPFILVLAAMERAGVAVDAALLTRLGAEFGQRMAEIEAQIYTAAGAPFNVASPKQLGEVLFEKLALPHGRKTKTGWSTDVKVLEKLALEHELPALVLAHRNLAKLKNTYVDRLLELREADTGRVHSSFNQCGTATGRLSSANPNLQNLPIRTLEGRRIRAAFVAPPGAVLLSADYSQIDLRVLAHYSQDAELLAAFRSGADIHRETAAEIFGVMPELVTGEMRRVAKSINFGIVYGMSSFGLARQLEVGRREAQGFIDRYFTHFPGIRAFMERVIAEAHAQGFVSTLAGRRRYLPDLQSKNRAVREFAERTAINTPIQGTAADIIKIAMLRLQARLAAEKLASRMVLQIHDELVLEMPEAELETLAVLTRETMEQAMALAVPLVVNISSGPSLDRD
ncbi:DNA polymerase I [Desulfobulbus oralis]|uniref:DNA polymerase I n=1 Tax=Desulfobulbus oralis TaxID=1986146 RepID=A0A2L1GQK2_9BACT|nr:DNA polymerase I [Desulfobulbus oralis]AVD71952.1 DNA polymerase I [Desulfobulbus oralis]